LIEILRFAQDFGRRLPLPAPPREMRARRGPRLRSRLLNASTLRTIIFHSRLSEIPIPQSGRGIPIPFDCLDGILFSFFRPTRFTEGRDPSAAFLMLVGSTTHWRLRDFRRKPRSICKRSSCSEPPWLPPPDRR